MPDDKTNRGPQDASRINMHEDDEVFYWTRKFGCTRDELAACVKSVGVMVADVEKCLSK